MVATRSGSAAKASVRRTIAPVVGFAAATAASSGAAVDFSAFVSGSSSPARASKPSSRWNVVTPITKTPAKKNDKSAESASSTTSAESSDAAPKRTSQNNNSGPTTSFGAKTAADFPRLRDKDIEIHTLVLGTHPSIRSLEEVQYYGHQLNAFWWIAGDCLGFKRAAGISPSTGEPYKFMEEIRTRDSNILSYDEQVETFCSKGFALWDIVASCERPGSLDSDITKDKPNDIPGFCKQHPSIRRIVLSNGTSGCSFFKKHFKGWLDTGEVVPSSHKGTRDQFKKWAQQEELLSRDKITVISALAVSPAAARYTFTEKRDFWEEFVYKPGLADFEASQRAMRKGKRKRGNNED